jgi:hypothetical protein
MNEAPSRSALDKSHVGRMNTRQRSSDTARTIRAAPPRLGLDPRMLSDMVKPGSQPSTAGRREANRKATPESFTWIEYSDSPATVCFDTGTEAPSNKALNATIGRGRPLAR